MNARLENAAALVWLVTLLFSTSGCGNAAAEQAAFRKIKEKGGKLQTSGNGIEIVFSGVEIADDDLACLEGLTHVHELTLEYVDITDKGIDYLFKLDQLDRLVLVDTKITEPGIAKLKQRFPDIRVKR